jgi:hypothetical protein
MAHTQCVFAFAAYAIDQFKSEFRFIYHYAFQLNSDLLQYYFCLLVIFLETSSFLMRRLPFLYLVNIFPYTSLAVPDLAHTGASFYYDAEMSLYIPRVLGIDWPTAYCALTHTLKQATTTWKKPSLEGKQRCFVFAVFLVK